jgi:hypothetical protein
MAIGFGFSKHNINNKNKLMQDHVHGGIVVYKKLITFKVAPCTSL